LNNLTAVLEHLAGALLVIGALFALIGSWGLAKLSDFYRRLHGPTKASTLGVGCMLVGACLFFASRGQLGIQQALIAVFLFITAPVGAHLLVKAALRRRGDSPRPPP
jgi:multicomponent K+:H+ antiporter subunit G